VTALQGQTLIDSLFNISRLSNLQYLGLREYDVAKCLYLNLRFHLPLTRIEKTRIQTKRCTSHV